VLSAQRRRSSPTGEDTARPLPNQRSTASMPPPLAISSSAPSKSIEQHHRAAAAFRALGSCSCRRSDRRTRAHERAEATF
jgi:hypothetical protein